MTRRPPSLQRIYASLCRGDRCFVCGVLRPKDLKVPRAPEGHTVAWSCPRCTPEVQQWDAPEERVGFIALGTAAALRDGQFLRRFR